ncbi:MAG: holo-ACP synthase [Candidatus Cloacimonetes bacterium]|nr:holo-ACP synthase [Candidatus Cloacimonadota bacterium]
MIIGIGCDIIEVQRIQKAIENNPRFCDKLFTAAEIEYCSRKANSYQSYAVRFAAKEAVMKALGTGWSETVTWLDIEIIVSKKGLPSVVLSGEAKEIAEKLLINNIHLSLSHEKNYAIAFVIMEAV